MKLLCFFTENSHKFTDYKNGKLPRKVSLRDRFGNMWPIGVTRTGKDIYFEGGWEKFIEDNMLELGDFLILALMDIEYLTKLLGKNGCLTRKELESQKGKNWASDSGGGSSSDDDDEEEEYEEEEEEERVMKGMKTLTRNGTFKRVSLSFYDISICEPVKLTVDSVDARADACKVVTAMTHLYIPNYVVRDYKLELPSSIIIHDSTRREFESKSKSWKDGRIWLCGGWRNLCKWNLVEKNGKCICEFVRRTQQSPLFTSSLSP
ncbi:hypothetical protein HAX54_012868 [Datura stramonium]|uniref:TF-B3 domain-containing protein n=1 Tax=Datura stramonium TaxID=4076 RepID=A0ABS8RXN3_DATST|nr:hypothetical protein [Datura stramonium]